MPEIWERLDAAGLSSTRGLRRLAAALPRLPRRRRRQGRDHRRHRGARGDLRPLHRQPGVLQPAAQVQDRADRPPQPRRRPPRPTTSSFVGTVHPEHGPGFDLWVGGGLSTNPMLAQKLGVWIPLDEVADAWEGVASIFRDYGYRRLRSRARLKFLVADWGVEKFREVLENEYLGRELVDCNPRRRRPSATATTSACTSRRTASSTSASRRPSAASPARMLVAARRPDRGVRRRRRPADAVPEDRADRRRRRPGRGAGRPARRDRALGPAVELAAQHDGLHRHRVLQARDRRHQGPRPRPGRRARAPLPRPRHPDHGQRQRLPQRLRPHPGRRHRPQGPAGARRRRRAGRGLPGAPRRRAPACRPTSAASCAPTR